MASENYETVGVINEVGNESSVNFGEICNVCKKSLKNKSQLSKHRRNIHKIKPKGTIYCVNDNCSEVYRTLNEYREHLKNVHQVENITDRDFLVFPTKEDFDVWLANEEKTSNSSFIMCRGFRKSKTCMVNEYQCCRTGCYKTKGRGMRQLKSQGTIKIGVHCTAKLKLKIFESHVECYYYKHHYGHDSLLGCLPITEDEQFSAGKNIERVWQRRLRTIANAEKKAKILITLKRMRYELDINTFHKNLSEFLTQLEADPETNPFFHYFKKNYVSHVEAWAYCYKEEAKANANMLAGTFRTIIKNLFLEGHTTRQADKEIEALMSSLKDEQYDEIIRMHENKLSEKLAAAVHRHEEANEMTDVVVQKVDEHHWKITSSSSDEAYDITRNHICDETYCDIGCKACSCCFWAFKCTCDDCMSFNNMCKHIHIIGILNIEELRLISPICDTVTDMPHNTEQETVSNKNSIVEELLCLLDIVHSKNQLNNDVAWEIMSHLKSCESLLNVSIMSTS